MLYVCSEENEKIENYEKAAADNFKGWDLHHRLGTHTEDGEKRPVNISREELKKMNLYYNRPANELIYLPHDEHIRLHHLGVRGEIQENTYYAKNRDKACERQREYDQNPENKKKKKEYLKKYMKTYKKGYNKKPLQNFENNKE